MNAAEALGYQDLSYALRFVKFADGEMQLLPFVQVTPNPSWSAREYLEKRREVILAAIKYGHHLSPHDEDNLKRIEALKSKLSLK